MISFPIKVIIIYALILQKIYCSCSNNSSKKWEPSILGPLASITCTNLLLYKQLHSYQCRSYTLTFVSPQYRVGRIH